MKTIEEMAFILKVIFWKEFHKHVTECHTRRTTENAKRLYTSQYPEVREFFVDSPQNALSLPMRKRESKNSLKKENLL